MNKKSAVCIILARGGSKGVPDKNLRQVGGLSLVARAVLAARAARGIDRIVVSTDADAIATEARVFGADVIGRPADISGDSATSEAGWLHALDMLDGRGDKVERLVFVQCTSPFTTGDDLDRGLLALDEQNAACALSVVPDHGFLWRRDADGFGHGVNHDEALQRQRRQDMEPAFRESGAFYCVDTAAFRAAGQRFCGPVALVEVDHPAVEIDSLADIKLCNQLTAGRNVVFGSDRLRGIKALVMDFDGVHTDDLVMTDANGVESVRCSRSDGMGLGLVRQAGRHRLLILSKECNPVVQRRAEKLGIEALGSIKNKVDALAEWLSREELRWDEVLFVGNDVNDLAVLQKAGLSACPSDAHASILGQVDWVLPKRGGQGALRAICDQLLAASP